MSEPLTTERRTFEVRLQEWRQEHVGEFVLIKGDEVVGFYGSLADAFAEGMRRYGLEDFFIDQIRPQDVTNVTFIGQYHFQVH
jgi:hypothetical protein